MIPDLSFKDTWSEMHFGTVIVHQRGSQVPWGTLYQKTYGSNWFLERRLSSTELEITNMGTERKSRAILYTREFAWDLAERGLLNPSPQPSLRVGSCRQINRQPSPTPDRLDKHDPDTTVPQPPDVRHPAHTTGDENTAAVGTQPPTPLLRRVLRALLPSRQALRSVSNRVRSRPVQGDSFPRS